MIILFSATCEGPCERLLRAIEGIASKKEMEICRNIDAFLIALCKPRSGVPIVIVFASSEKAFMEVYSLRDLLWDVRLILVLPDSDPENVCKGHLLRPRFMADCTGDLQEIVGVLERMIEKEASTVTSWSVMEHQ